MGEMREKIYLNFPYLPHLPHLPQKFVTRFYVEAGERGREEDVAGKLFPPHCTSEPQSFVREKGGLPFVDSL